jgi:hypothetical protein
MKSKVVFWVIAAIMVLAQFNDKRWKPLEVFDFDAGGYYAYLPTILLDHAPARVDSLEARLRHQQGTPRFIKPGVLRLPGNLAISKYPLGVALADLPWFGGAHAWAHLTGQPANGISRPYQQAMMLAGLFHGLLGLWLLRRLLRHLWPTNDAVVAWTLVGIGLGTNAFCYFSYEAAMAHAPLFLWQTALLTCVVHWHETFRPRYALGMGLFLGLAVLVRPTEALFALLPLTWGLTTLAALRQRPALLAQHAGTLAGAAAIALLIIGLQPLFWQLVTHHWYIYTYRGEGFNFLHPHLLDGLFSYRKGWLLYTPLVGLMLLGLPSLRRQLPAAVPAVLVVVVYVTFSWREWYYGGGFSARPLISLYPLLALPLASLLAAAQARSRGRYASLRMLLAVLCALNLWQTWQFSAGIIHYDSNTRTRYWHNFFTVSLRDLKP